MTLRTSPWRGVALLLLLALPVPAVAVQIVWELEGEFETGTGMLPGTAFELSMSFDPDQALSGFVVAGELQLLFGPPFVLRLETGGSVVPSSGAGQFVLNGGYCFASIGFGAPSCNHVIATSGSPTAPDPMPFGFELEAPLDTFLPPFETSQPSEWLPATPPPLSVLTTARVFLLDPADPGGLPLAEGTLTRLARVPEPSLGLLTSAFALAAGWRRTRRQS